MIRFIIAVLFITVFFIFSIILYPIYFIIGKFNINLRHRISLATIQWVFRVISFIAGAKVDVKGREKVPEGPVLYVANHRSVFDIITLYGYLGRRKRLTGFVAKKETRNLPVIGWWMRLLHCRFLDRKDIRQGLKVILECVDEVKSGVNIVIYPEGTRGKGEDETELAPFKEGSLKIAVKAGSKIIPVAMSNTRAVFEEHLPFMKACTVRMTFGQALDVNGFSKDEQKHLGEITRDRIVQMLRREDI